VSQHNGFEYCVYVISGRKPGSGPGGAEALRDIYEFNPAGFDPGTFDPTTGQYTGAGEFARPWRARAEAPNPVMAGTAAPTPHGGTMR